MLEVKATKRNGYNNENSKNCFEIHVHAGLIINLSRDLLLGISVDF